MRFLFVMPTIGQPRYAKRINMLQNEGVVANAAAFERDYHRGRVPDCSIDNLGRVYSGSYLKRVVTYLLSIKKIRRLAKGSHVVYSFGFDLFLLTYLATIGLSCKRVLEVGDIRKIQTGSSLISKILRALERLFAHKIDLLVVTSSRYYTEYYEGWLNVSPNCLVVENKLEKTYLLSRPAFSNIAQHDCYCARPIRIGYFGLLRCAWSAETLYELARKYPNSFEIVLAGRWILGREQLEKILKLVNVSFLGEYRSPDDLERLYSKVDIVWAGYSFSCSNNFNLFWAKTNRYYESLFYFKPLITTKGSCDEADITNFGIGLGLEYGDPSKVAEFLNKKLSLRKIDAWRGNMLKVPDKLFVYEDEASKLIDAIK